MKINLKLFLKPTVVATVLATIWLTAASAWATGSSSLVIAEVYGGGGNSGSTYKNDFIVVFNRSASSVDVNGWSVQYASGTGTGAWAGETTLATSSKIIPAGGYFLVQESAGAGGTTSLPTPDATGTLALSATVGKVALCNNSTLLNGQFANGTGPTIVDFVGFGATANGFEGTGPTPAPANPTSVQRANQGCTDTDQNNADFSVGSPNPRNSATATHSCAVVTPPTISDISPSSVTTNAGNAVAFTVTLSAGDSPLSYFWYKETGSTTNLIPSATTATLTLANVIAADLANYQVVVSNASTVTATSAVVSLTAVIDPAINTQPPPSQTLLLYSTATFTVGAGGTPTVGCQWYTGTPGSGTPVSNGGRISGANTSSMSITNLAGADANTYFVIVTNGFGAVTSSVTALTVVTNNGALAFWDFNGPFDANAPAPTFGSGSASPANVVPFVLGPNYGDGNDIDNATAEGQPNNGWGTSTYPAQGTSNKLAGARFNVSTVGAKNVNVSYDTRATTTSSKYERLQYTTNGTDFIDYPASSSFTSAGSFSSQPLSFSLAGFPGVRNNANFGIRVVAEFENTARYNNTNNANYVGITSGYGTAGTLCYDRVTISADAITNANTPPTISSIPNQTMEDTFGTNVNFTVNDTVTAAGSLSVVATSLDPNVSLTLNVINTGGSCQLSISSSLGNSTVVNVPVLVTVTDGNADSTVTWFTLTINPGNTPPVITGLVTTNMIANGTLVIPFTLTDDHTDVATITPTALSGNTTLVSNDVAHISLGGSGTSRTLTVTPVTNQFGTVPITVTASDGSKSSSYTFALVVRPSTSVVLNDYFTYNGSGYIVTQSGGFWQSHSGTANQVQAGSGAVYITGSNSEDVNAPFIGAPYLTNNPAVGPGVLYSKMQVTFTALPTLSGAYFAHFKDNTIFGFLGRVWASTLNAADGKCRLGIGNSSGTTNSTAQFPLDLDTNVAYTIVTRLVLSNAVATLWINPTSESSRSVTDVTVVSATNVFNIYAYALRQSAGEGDISISNLVVSTSFNDAVGIAALDIKLAGTNAVLTWSSPTFSLQQATNVAGPYTTISGANSGFTTNTASSSTKFFRLYHP
jgi:hypothetical protein